MIHDYAVSILARSCERAQLQAGGDAAIAFGVSILARSCERAQPAPDLIADIVIQGFNPRPLM